MLRSALPCAAARAWPDRHAAVIVAAKTVPSMAPDGTIPTADPFAR